jgi:hypothetical protein
VTYADISESFDGGAPGDLITTANTAFPYIVDGTFGGAEFTASGAVGQGAAAVVPADPSTHDASAYLYDSAPTDTTSTIAADDWTARGTYRISDSTSASDPGYGFLNLFVGEPGRTPANWSGGTASSIDVNYNAGDKTVTVASPGIASDTFSIAAYLGTWITVEVKGTNGSFDYSIRDAAGAVIRAVAGNPLTAGLYRARSQATAFRSVGQAMTFEVDEVYFGRTTPTATALPAAIRVRRSAPLVQHPRDDGRGTSTAPLNYPLPTRGHP